MKRLMIISDRPTQSTGFGTALRNLLMRIKNVEKYVVSPSGYYAATDPEIFSDWTQLTFLYPKGIKSWYLKIKPDIVMVYGSYPQMNLWYNNRIKHPNIILYIVIENEPIPKDFVKIANKESKVVTHMNGASKVFTPSEFSKKLLIKAGVKKVNILPHGVDSRLFRPMRMRQRRKFVYGYVGANNIRKQLPRLLEAFARIHDLQSILYLVTDPYGRQKDKAAENLEEIAKENGIEKLIRWHPFAGNIAIPTWDMPKEYNKMNVHVLPSGGESFGLTCLEAASCGVTNIVNEYGGPKEFLQDSGLYIKVKTFIKFLWGRIALIDIDDLVEKMIWIKQDNELRERLSKRSRQIALKMTWDIPAKILSDTLKEYL